VAEGARLESVFTRKGNVGSNPTLSAIFWTLDVTPGFVTSPVISGPILFFAEFMIVGRETFQFRASVRLA
jgi:hypothetical protein